MMVPILASVTLVTDWQATQDNVTVSFTYFFFNSVTFLQFGGNKTSREMGPKCTRKAIGKHARMIWLDKNQ